MPIDPTLINKFGGCDHFRQAGAYVEKCTPYKPCDYCRAEALKQNKADSAGGGE